MKQLLYLLLFLSLSSTLIAQSVGLGTTTPNPSAALDVSSQSKGILIPRMSSEQREDIESPAQGLLVFDLTTNSFWFRNPTTWVELADSVNAEVHRISADKIYTAMTDQIGIGTNSPANKVDIVGGGVRTGIHPTGLPLYVTGTNQAGSNGVEFRNDNGSQGIGFGNSTIYAAGSDLNQHLGMSAKGIGGLIFSTGGLERVRINPIGRVGIGLSSPLASLDVVRGADSPEGTVRFQGTTFNSNFNYSTAENTYIRGGKAGSNVILNDLPGLGNVGIGMSAPHAPLQFSNSTGRKIVLYEVANTDHKYFGFGINPDGSFRYQTPVNVNDHVFYSAASDTSSNELMRIKGTGNVGIGTNSPFQKLHVAGKVYVRDSIGIGFSNPHAPLQFSNNTGRKIVLAEAFNNNHQYFGFGINPDGSFRYQTPISSNDHVFYTGTSDTSSAELMRITGTGHVGIGTSTPFQRLTVAGNTYVTGNVGIGTPTCNFPISFPNVLGDKISLWGQSGAHFGFGIAGSLLQIHTDLAGSDIAFGYGSSANFQELMRIKGTGNVGIGISDPLASLDVMRGSGAQGTARFQGTTYNSNFNYSTAENTYIRGGKAGSHVILNELSGLGNVGVGITPTNKLDIQTGAARTGNHATGRPMYVTGDLGDASNGVEIRHNNATQGVGIGFNTLYAAGTNTDQDLGMSAKGAGKLFFKTNGVERVNISGSGDVNVSGSLKIGYTRITSLVNVPPMSNGTASCNCPTGTQVMGGGYSSGFAHTAVNNYPNTDTSWYVEINNPNAFEITLTAYAICARIGN